MAEDEAGCVCCGGAHEARACPHYDARDRELLLLGATLLVNHFVPGDYGQNVLLDFEQALQVFRDDEEENG